MPQMLLLPDPRPLVERLGAQFFRQAPQSPGVYLMRDRANAVVYVGKARNLRQRLAHYRVANPDRLPRRQLRLLRVVARIELELCADEAGALARESELLRSLRPKYNRAGTWPGTPRFLAWRLAEAGLDFGVVTEAPGPSWESYGPLGAGAFGVRAVLVRLLWCALQPERGLAGMPEGWFSRRYGGDVVRIRCCGRSRESFAEAAALLREVFAGRVDEFAEWVRRRTAGQDHPFEVAVRDADLEALAGFRV